MINVTRLFIFLALAPDTCLVLRKSPETISNMWKIIHAADFHESVYSRHISNGHIFI